MFPKVLLPRVKGVCVEDAVGRKQYHDQVAMHILVKVCLFKYNFFRFFKFLSVLLSTDTSESSAVHCYI